jgi:hypothetical protein
MPDNAKIISDWLRSKKGQFCCHTCISENTGVTNQAQVSQLTRPLGNTKEFQYRKTTCARCQRERTCAAYVGTGA